MKKIKFVLIMLCLVSMKLDAQTESADPSTQMFDTLYDRYGHKYHFRNLQLGVEQGLRTIGPQPNAGNPNAISPPGVMCSAGFFNVYFAPGSGAGGPSPQEVARRNTICNVFQDVAGLLNGANWNSPTVVSILIDNIALHVNAPSTSGVLGVASAFYAFPGTPTSANPGITYNAVQKTIQSKQDAYINTFQPGNGMIVPTLSSQDFYHGFMAFNFYNPAYIWEDKFATTLAGPGEFDLYTVVLHELTHSLGFASLVSPNGFSLFGQLNNYYGLYDKFLYDYTNTKVIQTSSSCSPSQYGMAFNSNMGYFSPNCSGPYMTNVTACSTAFYYSSPTYGNIEVYTPDCFESGSSLSHFEDMCYPSNTPANNDQIFTMSNAMGQGVNKRFLTEEERTVLCDLGYDVIKTYVTNAFGVAPMHVYSNNACSSTGIWGVNDGWNGTNYVYVSNPLPTSNNITIPIGGISLNDSPNTVGIKCIESVYSNGVASQVGSNIVFVPSSGFSGPVLIRYIPFDANGDEGNITYIHGHVNLSEYCSVASSCGELVQNGGFETHTNCGAINLTPFKVHASCWQKHTLTPDLYVRGCTDPVNSIVLDLGNNTSSVPMMDSYNGSPNNAVMGFGGYTGGQASESAVTKLATALIPGQNYVITFWANSFSGNRTDPETSLNLPYNLSSVPVVLTFAASNQHLYTTGNFFPMTSLNVLQNCQVGISTNTWQQYSYSFVCPSVAGQSYLYVGVSTALTEANVTSQLGYTYGYRYLLMVDDISIKTSLFNTTSLQTCLGQSILNLGQYATVPGVFSGPGISGQYNFNSPPSLGAGTYAVNFTPSSGCMQTLNITIINPPGFGLAAGGNTVCTNSSAPVSIALAAQPPQLLTYQWQPGGMTGNPITVPPNTIGTYVVTATDIYGCSNSQIITLTTNCCPIQVPPTFPGTNLEGGAIITGPYYITQNITISGTPGSPTIFQNGEFRMAPGVKITVAPGNHVQVLNAHFYCCNGLWKGFDVQNGAKISGSNSLIEDAETAINLDNVGFGGSPMNPPISMSNVIFNQNYVGINISNGVANSNFANLNILLESCVFTSRDLPFTSTTWPNSSTTNPGLRANSSPTTGLAAPFNLQNYPFSNLNQPYQNQPGHIGVRISDIGNVQGSTPSAGIKWGDNNAAGNFNLFDGLGVGVEVTDANLTTMNNVFQNMKVYTIPVAPFTYGGTGISFATTSLMNARLDLRPWSTTQAIDFGNRFWQCYTGVQATNAYNVQVEYAVFRSTQAFPATPGSMPGNKGIECTTNRFMYNISKSDFNNIENAIGVYFAPANYNMGSGIVNGIYANNATINENYIDAVVSNSIGISNQYVSKAITVSGPHIGVWSQQPGTSVDVRSNNANRVYRGIWLDGMDKYPCNIDGNSVRLVDDYAPNVQYGIWVQNTSDLVSVARNTMQGQNLTNQNATLIFCNNNSSTGQPSPKVLCNDVSNCYIGFDFDGANNSTQWRGNIMTNLANGLVLSSNGVIGQQGNGPNNNSGNQWISWPPSNLHTLVRGGSSALNSVLYVKSSNPSLPWYPINNGGPVGSNYSTTGALSFAPLGNYSCPVPTFPAPPVHRLAILGISDPLVADDSSLEIFPNPSEGRITLKGSLQSELLEFELVDVSGKIVQRAEVTTQDYMASLDLRLDNGIYIARIKSQNARIRIVKLIINK